MPSYFQIAFFAHLIGRKREPMSDESSRLQSVACQLPDHKDQLLKFHDVW